MSNRTLSIECDQGMRIIYLSRPEVMNAFTYQMGDELIEALKEADMDNEVRVVIVTGDGDAFCAGMDLSKGTDVFQTDEAENEFRDIGGEISRTLFEMNKPVIAAINGVAVGVGITMTLAMDIRILQEKAKVGFVFGRVGIGPESLSSWFLPKLVGMGKAQEWLLTARMIQAEEALASGLVQSIETNPLEKARELAQLMIRQTSACSNAFSRQALWQMAGEDDLNVVHRVESKFLYWAARNGDATEGIHAFKEKRLPTFPARLREMPDFFRRSEEK